MEQPATADRERYAAADRERYAAADRERYDVIDDGPTGGVPILLLHGFPQTAEAWRPIIPALLAHGHRVLAPTQRGYTAGSPQDVESYAMPHLVADVVSFLDARGIARAHGVGHDWGGSVAWQVAARHPDRIRSLTVLATPHPLALGHALRTSRRAQLRFSYAALLRLSHSETALGAADAWACDGGCGPRACRPRPTS